jgi:hypothetical protein
VIGKESAEGRGGTRNCRGVISESGSGRMRGHLEESLTYLEKYQGDEEKIHGLVGGKKCERRRGKAVVRRGHLLKI